MKLGYTKQSEVKLIRVNHAICFREGYSAASLMDLLKHVPPKAKITDIYDEDEDGENYSRTVIEFVEEAKDEKT